MNKYLAVIKDSFREALASRVLWLVLVVITLVLMLLAPFSYREELTSRLNDNDVNERVLDIVRRADASEKPSPARHVWMQLDEELRDRIAKLSIPGVDDEPPNVMEFMRTVGHFRTAVNKLIEERGFYDEEAFAGVQIVSGELRDLRERGIDQLSDREAARFNRLLLEASFPDLIRTSPPTSLQFVYGWADLGGSVPLRSTTLRENMRSRFVFVLSWVVGPVGLLIAILVTASIIPQMFEPGSLHLLLSKPVSRSLLFLARYFGGCAFVCIAAVYMIGGVWLVLGVRFNLWDQKILLSIPIYLFMFAIYYAVSSLAGVYYRSTIVCIGLTIVFWAVCFGIGLLKGVLENSYWSRERFTRVVEVRDDLVAVNEIGIAHRWNPDASSWDEIFVSDGQKQVRGILRFLFFTPIVPRELRSIGPIYDQPSDRLVAIRPNPASGKAQFFVGPGDDEWKPAEPTDAPMGSFQLFREPDGKVLIVSSLGLYRLTGDPSKKDEPLKLFGFALPLPSSGPFEKASPEEGLVIARPSDAAMNERTGELAVYTRGTVKVLARSASGNYETNAEMEIADSSSKPIALGFAGQSLLLAHQDGRIQVLDAHTLRSRSEFSDESPNQPRFVAASPDGRWFAVLFHNGRLWTFDAESNAMRLAPVSGQGDISGVSFSTDSELFVIDKAFRVSRYSLDPFKVEHRYSPTLGFGGILYRYVLVPVYTMFPKPGKLDETFQYLLSGKDTQVADSGDLSIAQAELNPWAPVWSSALFMFVVLGIACVYIEWQEF
ncbi:MAG: ABC transporter permease subunit [Planctomycetota bacterium]|nr:ABC transporter permease subunit [Planctomycetota bacterium]